MFTFRANQNACAERVNHQKWERSSFNPKNPKKIYHKKHQCYSQGQEKAVSGGGSLQQREEDEPQIARRRFQKLDFNCIFTKV